MRRLLRNPWVITIVGGAAGIVLATWFLAWHWADVKPIFSAIEGWPLVSIVTTCAALAFGYLWYRAHRKLRSVSTKPQFRHIEVEDKRLNLRWFIRRRPSDWLQWRDVASTIAPALVQEVLDGPFHAACMAPLAEFSTGVSIRGGCPMFDEHCKHCGRRIFINSDVGAPVWNVRALALEELQRMRMTGTKMYDAQWTPPIVLENPGYWKLMLPPT